jgi:hypothetical protein
MQRSIRKIVEGPLYWIHFILFSNSQLGVSFGRRWSVGHPYTLMERIYSDSALTIVYQARVYMVEHGLHKIWLGHHELP